MRRVEAVCCKEGKCNSRSIHVFLESDKVFQVNKTRWIYIDKGDAHSLPIMAADPALEVEFHIAGCAAQVDIKGAACVYGQHVTGLQVNAACADIS